MQGKTKLTNFLFEHEVHYRLIHPAFHGGPYQLDLRGVPSVSVIGCVKHQHSELLQLLCYDKMSFGQLVIKVMWFGVWLTVEYAYLGGESPI